ncbi:unnamed protein product [Pleuronectes platessa]|uniref:Uncharacterized protein n=1 Tax=Pleuronectes platessa TaxID=8262 RepID=A0A9N7YE65_PLEPL|nr:unnamed protein product [Pleuronectes platessa]
MPELRRKESRKAGLELLCLQAAFLLLCPLEPVTLWTGAQEKAGGVGRGEERGGASCLACSLSALRRKVKLRLPNSAHAPTVREDPNLSSDLSESVKMIVLRCLSPSQADRLRETLPGSPLRNTAAPVTPQTTPRFSSSPLTLLLNHLLFFPLLFIRINVDPSQGSDDSYSHVAPVPPPEQEDFVCAECHGAIIDPHLLLRVKQLSASWAPPLSGLTRSEEWDDTSAPTNPVSLLQWQNVLDDVKGKRVLLPPQLRSLDL